MARKLKGQGQVLSGSPSGQFSNFSPKPIQANRAPTTADTGYEIGQLWADTNGTTMYGLSAVSAGSATWNLLGPGASDVDTLTGDSGGAISPSGGNITLAGTANQITTTGSGSTITWSLPNTLVAPGSFTATSGDITATSGNFVLTAAATQLEMNGGAATDFIGQATLVSGTVTVANTNIAANDRIFLTRADANSSTALGELTITAQTASTSFVITALDPADGSTTITGDVSIVNYFIVRQN